MRVEENSGCRHDIGRIEGAIPTGQPPFCASNAPNAGYAIMIEVTINGQKRRIEADGDTPLLWVLRDDLGMTGTKYGCGVAQCGACSVLVDGTVMRSCVTPVELVAGRSVTTIEAVEQDAVGARLVEAWVKHQVPQCGYCQSGQVIAAASLLKQNPKPTDADVEGAMINLCRCGTYNAIKAAVRDVAGLAGSKGA
jgi:isoquinoline 1-oxidoreductase alpha subunit